MKWYEPLEGVIRHAGRFRSVVGLDFRRVRNDGAVDRSSTQRRRMTVGTGSIVTTICRRVLVPGSHVR
jgi:hypothetical protein